MAFVRGGTLDDPAALPPDIDILTSTKLPPGSSPRCVLPDGVPAVPGCCGRRAAT